MVSEILIRLLRIALGNEDSFRLPDSVDWEEVIQLAMTFEVTDPVMNTSGAILGGVIDMGTRGIQLRKN